MDDLIKRAKARDADAFTQLMQSQMQTMYKTARSVLRDDEDVADAVSDTILTCWEKLGQLQEDKYFRTWMTRILVNKCRDILRKKEYLFYTDKVPEVESRERGFENLEWEQALAALAEHYRSVVILYYVEGFKTSEIAQILQIPESTVRTRLARAREKLAEDYFPQERRRGVL
ncbi:MAG: sigma-70 family RNA polymerase sigma factor [Eubacteriales bacterium]|nr:sigma-70 family RNA polymerase sigma factor [Eubacteriales bacterium]